MCLNPPNQKMISFFATSITIVECYTRSISFLQCNDSTLYIHMHIRPTPARTEKKLTFTLVDLQLSRHDLWTYFWVPLQWHGAIKSSPGNE